ncbi:MAG: radical SAM family uncharacterized protein/radical SAM-linked protein [Myxococcota bacterium]|jgi:radical SAM family uncharacterized protein/radical SAM-linked protein
MQQQPHPYAAFVHNVLKPARYLGGEYQAVTKDWATVDVTVCMAFPDIYDIGMSHLGTKIIYGALNKHPRIACERAFTPWVDMEAELRKRGLPLVSLESARPLADFDAIGISLQYEMTYTNVLAILDLAGLPLRAANRDASHPLVFGGGPNATHPEPIAPFLDAILVGDAEEAFPEALIALAQWKKDGLTRRQQLEALAALGGWYCPALYTQKLDARSGLMVVDKDNSSGPYPVVRRMVEDINDYPFPNDSPVAAAEAIFDRMSIEISRGCTEGCRFCQAGMIYRPVRERDPEQIVDTVMKAIDNGGYDEVSLTSLSTADYSCISPLIKAVMERLRVRRASLGVSSLRAYGLDEDLLDEISSVKATGLTFAPEAGTQRMRDVVNKNISEEDIMTTAHRVFERGWSRMKFYFMIGLPTETDEDVAGIIETARKARDIGKRYHRNRVSVTASASSHVPKPHTPFQWAAMDSLQDIHRKQNILKDLGKRFKIPVKYHNHKVSFLEGIMARGDQRCGDLLEAVFHKGARLDSWDEHLQWDAWLEAIEEVGLDPQTYLGTLPTDGGLPWDHIDVGLAEKFLYKEWKRASKDRLSPPCGKPKGAQVHHTNVTDAEADERKLVCYHCGVACDMTLMRSERVDYLQKLNAFEPSKRADDEDFVPAYKQVRKNKRGQNLPPIRLDQGETFQYRLQFTKLGTIAMTSQLDLARMLPRIVRRAGVTMKYSSGFSPKALLGYGPALPLGISSLAEVVDIYTLDEMTPEALLEKLAPVSDAGLVFSRAARVEPGTAPIGRIAKLAEYIIGAPDWDADILAAAVALANGDEPVEISVTRKKGERVIDVRDGMVSLTVDTPKDAEVAAFGFAPGAPLLRYRVDLNEGAHVRATELVHALTGRVPDYEQGFIAGRTGIWGLRKGRVFDLFGPVADVPLSEHATLPRCAAPAAI